MRKYLNCKKIDTAISRAINLLLDEVNKNGIYENFGQKEVREIKDKFIDSSDYTGKTNLANKDKLEGFKYWCVTYQGK